jgi:hypothetical protein
LPDAVVVSSGSNAVIVYRTTAVGNGVVAFDPNPQIYFVGTAPASVTVADVNGDGIPDLLIANQGSNDVSVLFGSYDAGAWVGTPGPRLKSGGDGPLAVRVRDLTGKGVPDLIVTNGGSGTVTLLPGVGQGFFDDQHPRTLFDLGSALVQPPTFVGDSGLGYAVTASGQLVRFDLANLSAGPRVVFAGQDVRAARALASGDVVVALAGGSVEVLSPQGNGLTVTAELQAQGGVPVLPSALEVLQTAGGQAEVLVSSQGSDAIFVFASPTAVHPGPAGSPPAAEASTTFAPPSQVAAAVASGSTTGTAGSTAASAAPVSATSLVFTSALVNGGVTASLGGTGSAGLSGALGSTSSSLIVAPGSVTGLSTGALAGNDSDTRAGSNEAVLVSVQGSNYATVALLDFGSQKDDEPAGKRMPWLSTLLPLGDTSALSRFVSGHEEAVRQYGGTPAASPRDSGEAPLNDPWSEDLFHLMQPARPLGPGRNEAEPAEGGPRGLLPGMDQILWQVQRASGPGLWTRSCDPPVFLPANLESHKDAACEALAVFLAGTLLGLAQARVVTQEKETDRRLWPRGT